MRNIFIILMMITSSVFAAEINDVADVVSVTPRTRQVQEQRQECYTEQVQESAPQGQPERSYGGQIIGGVAGGLLGSQVGQGNGRVAAATAGAITGTIVGGNLSNNQQSQPQSRTRDVQRCRPVYETREVVDGYDVVYNYNGRTGRTVTRREPGRVIGVGISAQ